MLTIRTAHMLALSEDLQRRFELRLLTHVRSKLAGKASTYSDGEFLNIIHVCIEKAESYGITLESDVWRYVEYSLVYGPDFDSDPNLPSISKILLSSTTTGTMKMDRIDEYNEFTR